jgi:hypothetical protein
MYCVPESGVVFVGLMYAVSGIYLFKELRYLKYRTKALTSFPQKW